MKTRKSSTNSKESNAEQKGKRAARTRTRQLQSARYALQEARSGRRRGRVGPAGRHQHSARRDERRRREHNLCGRRRLTPLRTAGDRRCASAASDRTHAEERRDGGCCGRGVRLCAVVQSEARVERASSSGCAAALIRGECIERLAQVLRFEFCRRAQRCERVKYARRTIEIKQMRNQNNVERENRKESAPSRRTRSS